jgi:hypothetical protein
MCTSTNPNSHVCAQQFAAKQYIDSPQTNTGSPYGRSSNSGNMSVMTESTGKSDVMDYEMIVQSCVLSDYL